MPRFKLTVEYDGRAFVGWQRQDNGLSVQQCLEEAIRSYCGEVATVHGAGRTDAGVHALGQVAHVDLVRGDPPRTILGAINFHTKPHPVSVTSVEPVTDDFHARFFATGRRYCYRIISRAARLAVDSGRVWHIREPLDTDAMQAAAQRLLGHHDFTSFRSTHCQAKSPEKTLERLDVAREGEAITLHVEARSFMHNQVRIMTGSLVKVGRGEWTADDISRALEARNRAAAGPTAPAHGLYLAEVRYED